MELPTVGTVSFVIALTAFFTAQFNLKGNVALACAFGVALVFNLAPLVAAYFPNAAPFVQTILNTVLLAISAAGGYNFITKTAGKVGTAS